MEVTKTVPTKTITASFKKKKSKLKNREILFLVTFLVITIAELIPVSIYCCFIQRQSKQEHLLPYYVIKTNYNKLTLMI